MRDDDPWRPPYPGELDAIFYRMSLDVQLEGGARLARRRERLAAVVERDGVAVLSETGLPAVEAADRPAPEQLELALGDAAAR